MSLSDVRIRLEKNLILKARFNTDKGIIHLFIFDRLVGNFNALLNC